MINNFNWQIAVSVTNFRQEVPDYQYYINPDWPQDLQRAIKAHYDAWREDIKRGAHFQLGVTGR